MINNKKALVLIGGLILFALLINMLSTFPTEPFHFNLASEDVDHIEIFSRGQIALIEEPSEVLSIVQNIQSWLLQHESSYGLDGGGHFRLTCYNKNVGYLAKSLILRHIRKTSELNLLPIYY